VTPYIKYTGRCENDVNVRGQASKTAEPFWMGVPGGGQGPGCPFQGAINHNRLGRPRAVEAPVASSTVNTFSMAFLYGAQGA
jgi:hypothetical protein